MKIDRTPIAEASDWEPDHDDFCRLSRAFNEVAHIAMGSQDDRINEWLKRLIAGALPAPLEGAGDTEPGDLVDRACSLAIGFGAGRDDLRNEYVAAKRAVVGLLSSLRAERDAYATTAKFWKDQRDREQVKRQAAEASLAAEKQRNAELCDNYNSQLGRISDMQDALAAEKQRVVELERKLAEDLDVRRLNELKADCSVLRKRVAALEGALTEQRMKPGVRWVIDRLHRRAEEMNHYPAKQWLNSLAFELGVRLNDPAIDIDAAITVSVDAALRPAETGEPK